MALVGFLQNHFLIQLNFFKLNRSSSLNIANLDTIINALEKENVYVHVTPPSQAIFDKVSFLCNNLSQTNLLLKVTILFLNDTKFI